MADKPKAPKNPKLPVYDPDGKGANEALRRAQRAESRRINRELFDLERANRIIDEARAAGKTGIIDAGKKAKLRRLLKRITKRFKRGGALGVGAGVLTTYKKAKEK